MPKEIPLLFQSEMIRAVLANRKNQTRRTRGLDAINEAPDEWLYMGRSEDGRYVFQNHVTGEILSIKCPYGARGDWLWVREALTRPDGDPWLYAADNQPVMVAVEDETAMLVWAHHKDRDYCPSIHAPRWASRITLANTEDPIPQRVQDISEEDARAEGLDYDDIQEPPPGFREESRPTARAEFQYLWDSINGKTKPFSSNSWVWRVAFKRIEAANV